MGRLEIEKLSVSPSTSVPSSKIVLSISSSAVIVCDKEVGLSFTLITFNLIIPSSESDIPSLALKPKFP